MVWAALLLVVGMATVAVWLWYASGRQFAARTEAQRWQVVRHGYMVSAGVGTAILVLGVVAFVLTGYDWAVLALVWAFGLLHLGLLGWTLRRAHQRTGRREG